LIKFAPSSLDLEIAAYILTLDGLKFLEVQEELLLRIMEMIEANGTAAAFRRRRFIWGGTRGCRGHRNREMGSEDATR